MSVDAYSLFARYRIPVRGPMIPPYNWRASGTPSNLVTDAESSPLTFCADPEKLYRGDGVEGHGLEKFKDASLLATSARRSWTLLSAEIRRFTILEFDAFTPPNAEITQCIADTGLASSTRSSGGVTQEVVATPGTTWLCPAGIREEATRLTDHFPEVLHVYMPQHAFVQVNSEGLVNCSAKNLRYECRVSDPVVHRVTQEIIRELRNETSSGGLKIDAMAVELITALAHGHVEASPSRQPIAFAKGLLDSQRLDRVLQYVEANLETDITVADLAEAACFSLFHFARAFHLATGKPPHAYLSERRLDRAKQLLAHSNATLVDIALTCRFSGQANFTKAFKRAVGVSPGRYRQARG
jgi:AraC family transcriptional regulator